MDWLEVLKLAFSVLTPILVALLHRNTELTRKNLLENRNFRAEYFTASKNNLECIHDTKDMVYEILEQLKKENL